MQCNLCEGPASQVGGEAIYPHRPDLYRKRFWKCSACGAFVGCHANGKPLGTLADQETRRWRMKAHAAFDPMWQRGGMSRGAAYRHMQAIMGMTPDDAHISRMDAEQCQRLIRALTTRQSTKPPIQTRRTSDGLPDCGCTHVAPWEDCEHTEHVSGKAVAMLREIAQNG